MNPRPAGNASTEASHELSKLVQRVLSDLRKVREQAPGAGALDSEVEGAAAIQSEEAQREGTVGVID